MTISLVIDSQVLLGLQLTGVLYSVVTVKQQLKLFRKGQIVTVNNSQSID